MSFEEEHYRTWYYRNAVQGIRKVVEAIIADKVTKDKWVYFKALMDASERDAEICREVIEEGVVNSTRIHYVNHKYKKPEDTKSKLVSVDVALRGRVKGW